MMFILLRLNQHGMAFMSSKEIVQFLNEPYSSNYIGTALQHRFSHQVQAVRLTPYVDSSLGILQYSCLQAGELSAHISGSIITLADHTLEINSTTFENGHDLLTQCFSTGIACCKHV